MSNEIMIIEIRYDNFNGEWDADIDFGCEQYKYLASDNLRELFDNVYNTICEFKGYEK